MKFSALNIDFDSPSLDLLGSRKPVHKSIKEWYLRKSRYFIFVDQSFVKNGCSCLCGADFKSELRQNGR